MPVPRTPGLRVAKYQARLFYGTPEHPSEAIPYVMLGQKDTIMALITDQFANICEFETATKTILDEQSVSTTQYPFYLAFARQVYKAMLAFSGGTLRNRVNIILERWKADGLTQAILEKIRDEVFAIAPPGP